MNKNVFNVRAARLDDLDEILRLCAAHAGYERAAYDPAGKREKLAALLFGDTPRLYCHVVERMDRKGLAGYASWSLEASTWEANLYAHMDCLYLDEDARGRGLGRELMTDIARDALARGVTLLQWQTPAFNQDAIRFYERLGASRKDKVRFYLDAATMRKLHGEEQNRHEQP